MTLEILVRCMCTACREATCDGRAPLDAFNVSRTGELRLNLSPGLIILPDGWVHGHGDYFLCPTCARAKGAGL